MILPLAPALVFAAMLSWRLHANGGLRWRLSGLEAATALGTGVIATSELFGLGNALKPGWISLGWTATAAGSIIVIWRSWRHDSIAKTRIHRRFDLLRIRLRRPSLEWWGVYLVLLVTGIIAWVSPPTNFDSMTYQFPRVMHWLQQGSTDHYPTSNVRQLTYGPGAVYWQLHLWSLWDGDRAASLVQWFASIGSALALSVWIRRLISRRAVGLAILVGLTLPMGILQASSSQTDLQVTAWLLIAVTLMSRATSGKTSSLVFSGLAFGMAVLTKPVAVLVGVPLAVLVLWQIYQRNSGVATIRAGVITVVLGLLVCAPHFWRNQSMFGDPLGSSGGTLLEEWSLGDLTANTTRWALLNVPSMTVWESASELLEGIGADVNNPATTYHGLHFSPAHREIVYRLLLPDEDFAAYTPILILTSILAAVFWRRRENSPGARPWWIAMTVAALLYPAILQWQCWGNRLLLPLAWFALPLLLARTGVSNSLIGRRVVAVTLLLYASFAVGYSINRPLVELPATWRFAGDTQPPYAASRDDRFSLGYNNEATNVVTQFVTLAAQGDWRAIGLQVDWNYPEYVLWRALHEAGLGHVQVHHVSTVEGNGLVPLTLRFDGVLHSESAIPPP